VVDTIAMNTHTPTEDKSDGSKYSCYDVNHI